MQINIVNSYDELSAKAASIIISQLILKPDSVLGLATGSTPEGLYQHLIKKYNEGIFNFSQAKSFNLDEYVGLEPTNPNSYRYYMEKHLFSKIDLQAESIHMPNGMAASPEAECAAYEQKIKDAGGVDVQILGIGRNGHIGFNEPSVDFQATTHVVSLDEKTIEDNARFFDHIDDVPKQAISMGIKTIMSSKKIILLASGGSKAEALYEMIYGKISPSVPASILQLHKDVTVICDEAAGALIQGK
ncbi:MAG: glucosamine-6-phosphate deaminase [Clostridia bacterium]|nr:glucosamine-6-phosphate deaminase [Clostridia bacterium]